MTKKINIAVLALIFTNIIWGFAPSIFKLALTNVPPFTLAFFRFVGASILFLPAALIAWKPLTLQNFFYICLATFFGMVVNISFFFFGLMHGPSINASIIASSGPIILFIISVIWLHEKFKKKVFLGMLIALFGVLLIILFPSVGEDVSIHKDIVLANIFYIIATLGAVFSPFFAKHVLDDVNIYQFVFIGFLLSACFFSFGFLYEMQTFSLFSINYNGLIGILYGILFASALAYFLFYWATARILVSEIGLFTYICPVSSIILAILLLNEIPSRIYIIGASLVFLGIFIAEHRLQWHPFHKLKKINDK